MKCIIKIYDDSRLFGYEGGPEHGWDWWRFAHGRSNARIHDLERGEIPEDKLDDFVSVLNYYKFVGDVFKAIVEDVETGEDIAGYCFPNINGDQSRGKYDRWGGFEIE